MSTLPQASVAELCVLLVADIYGEVSSKVVSALLFAGRLNIPSLARKSGLPIGTIKQTLVVLIQQHLVVHYTHIDGGRDETWYECNWPACYELLHAGRIIRCMEDRFGEDGALIVSNLLQLGHARVSDFLSAYGTQSKTKKGRGKAAQEKEEGAKIEADAPITSVETLKQVMGEMLKGRYITEVKEHHMQPYVDVENNVRAEFIRKLRGQFTSELKLMKEVNMQVAKRMAELKAGDTSETAGMKRKAVTEKGAKYKKRKKETQSMYDDEEEEEEWEIDESLVVRVNHAKFLVIFRNAELVSLSEKRLGKAASEVYGSFLKLIEAKTHECHPGVPNDPNALPDDDPAAKKDRLKITTNEVCKILSSDVDLKNTFAEPPKEKAPKKKKKRSRSYDSDDSEDSDRHSKGSKKSKSSKSSSKKSRKSKSRTASDDSDRSESESEDEKDEGDSDDSDEESETDDDDLDPKARERRKRAELVKKHLELLASDSYGFVRFEGKRGNGEWSVNYKELGKKMRMLELENIVEEKYESAGTRLLRLLREKGKLEEKQLSTIALIKQNTIRSVLASMHEAGIVSIQEVPKSNPPQTSRTYFLWYVDEDRACNLLVSDIYKAMARNMQRTNVERLKRKQLLGKADRTDVRENPDEYLTKTERHELELWKQREEKLNVALERLDRVAMILRDF